MKIGLPKRAVVISVLLLTILFVIGAGFYCLRLIFGEDVEFRHGSLGYWLNTDKVVRNFPIFGAKPSEILYESSPQESSASATTQLTYHSRMNLATLLRNPENSVPSMGFTPLPNDRLGSALLGYTGKGYSEIYIYAEPSNNSGSQVQVVFVHEYSP